jgi:hypothetical protein
MRCTSPKHGTAGAKRDCDGRWREASAQDARPGRHPALTAGVELPVETQRLFSGIQQTMRHINKDQASADPERSLSLRVPRYIDPEHEILGNS